MTREYEVTGFKARFVNNKTKITPEKLRVMYTADDTGVTLSLGDDDTMITIPFARILQRAHEDYVKEKWND